MKHDTSITPGEDEASDQGSGRGPAGAQTLVRGLDVLSAIAERPMSLPALADRIGLSRSTAHRLAAALVDQRFLHFAPGQGYSLGPKLLELGHAAQQQMDLPRLARAHLEALAAASSDTVHLGVLDGERALYLDKVAGGRRINIHSRVGDRHPLRSTGLGKALLLDHDAARLRALYEAEDRLGGPKGLGLDDWLQRMATYASRGHAYDLEENEDRIRCVAAPVRDAGGRIVGAISVSSAAQYMDDARMEALSGEVRATAAAISRDLGWTGPAAAAANPANTPDKGRR